MTYTYEQAMRDAPKQHYNDGTPPADEPGWYVCKHEGRLTTVGLFWWGGVYFSVHCNQWDAESGHLDRLAQFPTGFHTHGWCKPWWPTPHLEGGVA